MNDEPTTITREDLRNIYTSFFKQEIPVPIEVWRKFFATQQIAFDFMHRWNKGNAECRSKIHQEYLDNWREWSRFIYLEDPGSPCTCE